MKSILASIAAGLLLSAAAPLWGATLTFDFDSSLLTVVPGQNAVFSGTLTNVGAATAFINGDSVTFPLPFDDTAFLVGAPASLLPAESFMGPVLTVIVGLGAPVGLYTGVFNVLGGDSPTDFAVLTSNNFAVQVVPEPAAWTGILGGMLALLVRGARRVQPSSSRRSETQ